MRKRDERKGADLIEEGTFEKPLGGSWKRGEAPHDKAVIGRPSYEGKEISTGRMQNDAWLEQVFTLPKPRGADARYHLTFDYQTTKRDSWYQIARDGVWGDQTPLRWDGSREEPTPLDFEPTPGAQDLAPTVDDAQLGIRFGYPATSDMDAGTLDVTNVSVRLYLGTLALRGLKIDDQEFDGEPFLYLCKGAAGPDAHEFKLLVAEGNVWNGTEVSLQKEVTAPPPSDLILRPGLGELQMIEDVWLLDVFDYLANDDFKLLVESKWDAEPHEVLFSIGDHRVVVAAEFAPAFDPIVNEQSVEIGVKVASYYTHQLLAEREMTFDGESAVTDANGEAFFDYSPKNAGLQQIEVLIDSLYLVSGKYRHLMDVKVLSSNPWNDAQISLGGGNAFPLGEKKGYPHRGEHEYKIRVTAPAGSGLLDYPVRLFWEGMSAEDLQVTVDPPLTRYVPWVNGAVEWTVNCVDALDGECHIGLQAERLRDHSELNTLSLAYNKFEVGERREANRSPVLDEGESVRVKLQILAAGSTEGARNVEVVWDTPFGKIISRTGLEGWVELTYKPETEGSEKLIARVKNRDDDDEAQIEESFSFTAIRSNSWNEHVELVLEPDNRLSSEGPLDFYCLRGSTLTLRMKPKPGSQLLGKRVGLRWRGTNPGLGLSFSPPLGQTSILEEEGLAWTMTADRGGSGWLELDFFTDPDILLQPWELSGRLIAPYILDEGVAEFDSMLITQGTSFPSMGAVHAFRFMPNPHAALSGLHLQLIFLSGEIDPRTLGIKFRADLGEDVAIALQGTEWLMDCVDCENSAAFRLDLALIVGTENFNLGFMMALGHNRLKFTDAREATIHPVIELDEAAYVSHRVCSHYTGEPVGGVPITYRYRGDEHVVLSRADGWAPYACQPRDLEDNVVEASLLNRYDYTHEKVESNLTVLESDPWVNVIIRATEDADQGKLGEKSLFPRRGSSAEYLIAPSTINHPVLEQDVRLGCTGTPLREMGSTPQFTVGAPRKMPMGGLSYQFSFGNVKDGSFGLFVAAHNLLKLSPVNPMSLGNYSNEEVDKG
ncbi:hypothetical protein [Pseudomonas sp. FP1740]|uniref:hypothetical protein n=1 Tax=Pseudomonas sp. FP1740 TaxID=2954078 RepID=UPI00273649CB|nr:hypothetical protein [Pseudomonas sp. FP1740]WLG43836.1 hypothetical protein PSH69_23735 [Pseudomonas sp. FP1740]